MRQLILMSQFRVKLTDKSDFFAVEISRGGASRMECRMVRFFEAEIAARKQHLYCAL